MRTAQLFGKMRETSSTGAYAVSITREEGFNNVVRSSEGEISASIRMGLCSVLVYCVEICSMIGGLVLLLALLAWFAARFELRASY
mmetsp:Transcript_37759/g.31912  ORF Transcript_37759/g.31912 Transcript_37759/m.31912 type:complete len:86 (-) Transcript_37759:314-571(-)